MQLFKRRLPRPKLRKPDPLQEKAERIARALMRSESIQHYFTHGWVRYVLSKKTIEHVHYQRVSFTLAGGVCFLYRVTGGHRN